VNDGDEARLANLLAVAATAVADEIRDGTAEAVGEHGAAAAALVALSQSQDGAPITRLAGVLGLTHSGAVRLVDRLVELGCVRRREAPDRRAVSVRLTPRGRAAAARAAAARAQATEPLLAALAPGDRARLSAILETLIEAVVDVRLRRRTAEGWRGAWLCRQCDFIACGRPDGRCPAANAAHGAVRP
jgi:MarR family transcriptional regulator, negative regulator of the multidrug operon emrRAB